MEQTEKKEKTFHGRAIYQPKGAAREYSPWACNLYNGCTNRCDYCYNRHGRSAEVLGKDEVTLKKSLGDKTWAMIYFKRELNENIEAIRKAGLFFSFVSDPMLPETIELTTDCVAYAASQGVNVQILTKQAWWVLGRNKYWRDKLHDYRDRIAIGFTLTGMDEMEHGNDGTVERISAMHCLHGMFHTFASIEPVINIERAVRCVTSAEISCDLFKVGLATKIGRTFTREEVERLFYGIHNVIGSTPVYWKDSVRAVIPDLIGTLGNSVDASYSVFGD